jgi:hypothetical protein
MAKKYEIKCVECDRTEKFIDVFDIKGAKWHIIGFNVNENIPICVCSECELGDHKAKEQLKFSKTTKKHVTSTP